MAEGQIQNDVVEFVTLLNHDDYEILNQFPFTIRRKRDHYVVKEADYRQNHNHADYHL